MLRIRSTKRALCFWGTLLVFLLAFTLINWLVPFTGDSQEQLHEYFPRFHIIIGFLLPFCSRLRVLIVLLAAGYALAY